MIELVTEDGDPQGHRCKECDANAPYPSDINHRRGCSQKKLERDLKNNDGPEDDYVF